MNEPIPPRFSFSLISPSRILLVFLTGIVPAVLILLSPLPFWIRVWVWVPVLSLSVTIAFGRVEGRSLIGVLSSAWSFMQRKRRYVWVVRRGREQGEVVARVPRRPDQGSLRRLFEGAVAYGTVTGIVLGITLLLVMGIRWAMVRALMPSDAARPAYAARNEVVTSPLPTPTATLTPTPLPIPSSTPTLRPTLTPSPAPTPAVWVFEQQWEVLALPGSMSMGNAGSNSCRVDLSMPGGEYALSIPSSEAAKVLLVPLLQPHTTGMTMTVKSTCNLDVEWVAFRAWHPQHARLWLIPVCDPPGRLWVRPHGGVITMAVIDGEGNPASPSVEVPLTGGWAPPVPAGGCWLYHVESTGQVWLEVIVRR